MTTAWPDLDRFEDPGYERILVLVFGTELGGGQVGERRLYRGVARDRWRCDHDYPRRAGYPPTLLL